MLNCEDPAKVLYLIAEGVPGFSERIQSWEQYNGVSTKGLVTFLPVPIQFMKPDLCHFHGFRR